MAFSHPGRPRPSLCACARARVGGSELGVPFRETATALNARGKTPSAVVSCGYVQVVLTFRSEPPKRGKRGLGVCHAFWLKGRREGAPSRWSLSLSLTHTHTRARAHTNKGSCESLFMISLDAKLRGRYEKDWFTFASGSEILASWHEGG